MDLIQIYSNKGDSKPINRLVRVSISAEDWIKQYSNSRCNKAFRATFLFHKMPFLLWDDISVVNKNKVMHTELCSIGNMLKPPNSQWSSGHVKQWILLFRYPLFSYWFFFFLQRSPKQRELLLKAEIFGSFYPNFFVMDLRQQDDHFTLWGPAFLVEGSGLHAIMATSARSRQEIL